MATGGEVLEMICPDGGWIISGDDFDAITWVDERPRCTKAEFESGLAKYDAWKLNEDEKDITKRQALLTKLGITADEARLLLG
jgi:hypothetical protein